MDGYEEECTFLEECDGNDVKNYGRLVFAGQGKLARSLYPGIYEHVQDCGDCAGSFVLVHMPVMEEEWQEYERLAR